MGTTFRMICILFLSSVAMDAKEYSVFGTVVNLKGEPLAGVAVYLEPIESVGSPDQLLISVRSDESGRFMIKREAHYGERMYLELDPPRDPNTFSPIEPPFIRWLPKRYPQLFRLGIEFAKRQKIDVGVLRADFPYSTLALILDDPQNSLNLGTVEDLSKIWIATFDKNDRLVGSTSFRELERFGAIDPPNLTIRLAVPRGIWRIRLCEDDLCGSPYGGTAKIKVGPGENAIRVRIDKPPSKAPPKATARDG